MNVHRKHQTRDPPDGEHAAPPDGGGARCGVFREPLEAAGLMTARIGSFAVHHAFRAI